MSAQMVEILVLAVIAFLIISKLLSILGTTDEDDPARKKMGGGSIFGAPSGMKDVTGTVRERDEENSKVISLHSRKAFSNDKETNNIISNILEKMPDFNPEKFLKGAKGAFKMVLEALEKEDEETLQNLVDRRFLSELQNKKDHYKSVTSGDMQASFEDAYSFGNIVYVKVKMKAKKLEESWVFHKNVQDNGPAWHLSNIA